MKQRSNEYWDRRAMERMAEYHRGAERTVRTLSVAYDAALANIQTEIDKIFDRYARDGRMSPEEARKLLNTPLTPRERHELTEQMQKVRDPTIRQQMLNRLNAAAYRARITRLQALRENIHLQTKQLADIEIKTTEQWYADVIDQAFYRNMFDIQRGLGLGFRFDPMPSKVVKEILRNPWSGKHFSRRVWADTGDLAKLLEEKLTAGFMSGMPRRRLAQELEEQMNVGKHVANRLVRTETTYMANSAEMESYEEAEIDEYQFIATLDSRTSETCRKHDLKVYAVKDARAGVNMPPLHPYCRSTTRAYFGPETLEGIQRRATDPKTGRSVLVPANMSYEDWKKEYSADSTKNTESGIIKRNSFRSFSSRAELKEWEQKVTPKWLEELSDEEREAIRTYTGSSYKRINEYLRRGTEKDESLDELIANISSGLQKFSLDEGITAYRGMSQNIFGMSTDQLVGVEFQDNAFVSASLLNETSFDGPIQLQIRVPAQTRGAYINPISVFVDSEFEFLLDKGTTFRIIEAAEDSGQIKITAEVVQDA